MTSFQQREMLLRRARKGDPVALDEYKEVWPLATQYFLDTYGDIGATAQEALIRAVAGDDLAHADGLRQFAALLFEGLAGPEPSLMELLLVQDIVNCWVMLNYADMAYAQQGDGKTLEMDEFLQKRRGRAQRQFLHAWKTLAQARKLLGLSVQVNVAEKQVNVMS